MKELFAIKLQIKTSVMCGKVLCRVSIEYFYVRKQLVSCWMLGLDILRGLGASASGLTATLVQGWPRVAPCWEKSHFNDCGHFRWLIRCPKASLLGAAEKPRVESADYLDQQRCCQMWKAGYHSNGSSKEAGPADENWGAMFDAHS